MPIPNDDAARRISRSVKYTERSIRPQSNRGRRFRVIGDGDAAIVKVLITSDVTAATVTSTTITDGTGSGELMKRNSGDTGWEEEGTTVDVVSSSMTAIRASSGDAIALDCYRIPGTDKYQVINDKDHRGLPDFDDSVPQRMIHEASGVDFKLVEICTDDVVTDVKVNVAGDELQKVTRPYDDCTTTTTKIADLEECVEE